MDFFKDSWKKMPVQTRSMSKALSKTYEPFEEKGKWGLFGQILNREHEMKKILQCLSDLTPIQVQSKNSDSNITQVSQISYYDELSSIDWDASKNKIIINQYGVEYDDMTIRQVIRKLYGPIHIHPEDNESIDAIDALVSSLPLTQYTLTKCT